MKPIRDLEKRVVCYANAKTGLVEAKYKKQTTKTVVPIGGKMIITRDNTETVLERTSNLNFKVTSYFVAA